MKKILPLLLLAGFLHPSLTQACEGDSTFLIARQDATFDQRGDAWTQEFSLSGDATQTLVLRFAAVYRASAVIINAADAATFRNGGSVSYYKGFENNFGTNSVDLTAGNYALAIRNNTDGKNNYSVELDCDKTFANATRVNSSGEATTVSPNGGKLWQPLDINPRYRLWIDGANYGLETFLIPEGELSAFQNGNTFNYYTEFSSTSGAMPGGYEINLPEGRYYLVFRNNNTVAMPLTYTIELFEKLGDGTDGGVAIDGQSSFSIRNNQLSAEIASLVNTRNTNTAPLRLLWLASADGTLSNVYTIAEMDLDELDSGNGSLAVGSRFTSITLTTTYTAPPYGSYRVILAVVETSTPDQVLDSVTYDSTHTLGTQNTSSSASSQARTSSSSSSSSSSQNSSSSQQVNTTSSIAYGGSGGGGGGAIHWFYLLALGAVALLRRRPNR